ncbi:MAG TPA: hypothetical protein VFP59_11525 [Candidatus Angelobacter sp.]|nr:hypothetical protein [Candidatus Angelobacter sp.]
MPMLEQATKWATNKMPKVINPTVHAIVDYGMAASFFTMAALFWKRNKPAAISCLVCGGADTAISLLTDYPGGVTDAMSFETHGRIDFGMSGLIASMPNLLRFSDEKESAFFRLQGMAMAAVTGLTDFTGTGERNQRERLDESAA